MAKDNNNKFLPIKKDFDHSDKLHRVQFAQVDGAGNITGLARLVHNEKQYVSEGVFLNNLMNGWGRRILKNGTEQQFWMKAEKLTGYVKQQDNNLGNVMLEASFKNGHQEFADADVPESDKEYFRQKKIVAEIQNKYT